MDWLLAPIDATRAHDLDLYAAWHGRIMVLVWAVILPAGILIARFCKIMPRQNWPDECDNRTWWYLHIGLQTLGAAAMILAFGLIMMAPGLDPPAFYHRVAGYAVMVMTAVQFLAAALRGSRGGPNHLGPDGSWRGDHYDMTRRRCIFEWVHKTVGYGAMTLAVVAVFMGLWTANGPRWMWLVIGMWFVIVALAFVALQRRGLAIDTYQAIWGIDAEHPGNHRKPIGFGVRRYQAINKD